MQFLHSLVWTITVSIHGKLHFYLTWFLYHEISTSCASFSFSVSSQAAEETKPEAPPELCGTAQQISSQESHPESCQTDSVQENNSSSSASSLGYNEQKPFTDEECLNLVKDLFSDSDQTVHKKFLCHERFCSDTSIAEKQRLSPLKFSHHKLKDYWWLSFVEGQGMFCILCKKHNAIHVLNKHMFLSTHLENNTRGPKGPEPLT